MVIFSTMLSCNKLEETSSGDKMCDGAIISTSMSTDRGHSAAEAVINEIIFQHQTPRPDQSNIA
uniref:Uncharacterized protein n=1 Tax=Onchocerca volvulus TaxID=6282 RepID=A0A8R1TT62_ONCVO